MLANKFENTLNKWLIEKTFYDMNEFYAFTHESAVPTSVELYRSTN